MSVYWIVKNVRAGRYHVIDGYEYFNLVTNTKNKKRAARLVKYYQEIEEKEKETDDREEISYFIATQKDPEAKYIAFIYNEDLSDFKSKFWKTNPEKGWTELTEKDIDHIDSFDVVYSELVKYKKNKSYAVAYPLKISKPELGEIRRYWRNYREKLNKKDKRYLVIERESYSGDSQHSYEVKGSFKTRGDALKEKEKLENKLNKDIKDEYSIIEQENDTYKYIAIIYDDSGCENIELWTKEPEDGWEEITDEETPNEYVEYKDNKGNFAATISI